MSTSPSYARSITNFFPFYPVSQFQRKLPGVLVSKVAMAVKQYSKGHRVAVDLFLQTKGLAGIFLLQVSGIYKKEKKCKGLAEWKTRAYLCCDAIPNTSTNWPRDPCV